MPAKKKQFARKESNTNLVLFCIAGGVIIVVVVLSILLSKKEEAFTRIRSAALGELPGVCAEAEKLGGDLEIGEAQKTIEAFRRKYPQLAEDEEFTGALAAVAKKLETKRDSAFSEDWDTFRRAYKRRNYTLCRRIAEEMRVYASSAQGAKLDNALKTIARAEGKTDIKRQLNAAIKEAEGLAARRTFGDAERLLLRFEREHVELDRAIELSLRLKEALKDIPRQRELVFQGHWDELLLAVARGEGSRCRSLLKTVESYGTAAQIRRARAKADEVVEDKPASTETSTVSRPAPVESPRRSPRSPVVTYRPEPERNTRREKQSEDIPAIGEHEAEEYLEDVRRVMRREFDGRGTGVTGTVTVFPDTLVYKLATLAAEMLKTGASHDEILKAMKGHVLLKGKTEKGRPLIELSLNVPSSYGLFVPKGDIRRHFVVKMGTSSVARQIVTKNRAAVFETWTVYTRDRHQIPRRDAMFWLLQGGFDIVLATGRSWKDTSLSIQVAGVWGLNKFKRGGTDWPGWNPERKVLQRYKREPIDFATEPVVYYAKDRDRRRVPPPPAIEALIK